MSNIYVQEPPCEGKICLETTVGDIDIELWSKECPKVKGILSNKMINLKKSWKYSTLPKL